MHDEPYHCDRNDTSYDDSSPRDGCLTPPPGDGTDECVIVCPYLKTDSVPTVRVGRWGFPLDETPCFLFVGHGDRIPREIPIIEFPLSEPLGDTFLGHLQGIERTSVSAVLPPILDGTNDFLPDSYLVSYRGVLPLNRSSRWTRIHQSTPNMARPHIVRPTSKGIHGPNALHTPLPSW